MKRVWRKLGKEVGKSSIGKNNSPVNGAISLDARCKALKEKFGYSTDIIYRNLTVAGTDVLMVYVKNLVDKNKINKYIMQPLATCVELKKESISTLAGKIPAPNVEIESDWKKGVSGITGGMTLLIIEGQAEFLIIDTVEETYRSVSEPVDELVVRGPHEGNVESVDKNIAMVRRKLQTDKFRLVDLKFGSYSGTRVSVAYLEGVAKNDVVQEVLKRLDQVDLDGVLDSGYLEEFIEDAPFSPFPTVGFTQKPDVVAAKMLEGRVAIFCDGSPIVLTAPHILLEVFQSPDDYYDRPFFPSLLRGVRLIATAITVLLPGAYVAIINFHPDFLPTNLLLTIAASSEGVPFPKVIEVLMMGLIFEILREAGLRIPTPMGQTISIVGALVLGDAAVRAGLVGAPVIIVTALTAISSFAIHTSMNGPLVFFRLISMISAAILGLLGVSFVLLAVVVHLCSIRSFGVNYLSPLAPLEISSLKDTLIRVPWWLMRTRPGRISAKAVRQKNKQRPRQVIMDD